MYQITVHMLQADMTSEPMTVNEVYSILTTIPLDVTVSLSYEGKPIIESVSCVDALVFFCHHVSIGDMIATASLMPPVDYPRAVAGFNFSAN